MSNIIRSSSSIPFFLLSLHFISNNPIRFLSLLENDNNTSSNNLPLLVPSGQFGTRLQGGKDAASARYLFTKLHPISRILFPQEDDNLLSYLNEDGQTIQPEYYIPILPTILVNGSDGVGTGWSTNVPTFHPIEIIDNIIRKMDGQPMEEMIPWSRGYKGTIERKKQQEDHKNNNNNSTVPSYVSRGKIERLDSNTLVITELPLHVWVDDYKEFLDNVVKPANSNIEPLIKGYTMQHTHDGSVKFILKLQRAKLEELEILDQYQQPIVDEIDGNNNNSQRNSILIEKFKLESTIHLNNMHLFDRNGILKKFYSPLEVIEEFYPVRMDLYQR